MPGGLGRAVGSDRSPASFRALRATATAAGCRDAERPHALDLLRADSEAGPGYGRDPVLIDALIAWWCC